MTREEPPHRQKKSKFTNIGNVLNTVVSKLGLDRRLREQALMNLWPIVAGDTFALNTRALFIDYENNLVVSVRDASTAQELSFLKRQITEKLKAAGRGAGITIAGIRFDLKHFHQAGPRAESASHAGARRDLPEGEAFFLSFSSNSPDPKSLEEIVLTANEINEIGQLKSEIERNSRLFLEHATEEEIGTLSLRIAKIAERELRLKKWQELNGFPACQDCGAPSNRLHTQARICAYCYLKKNAD
ncbi:MAG: hypothetical protein C5B53_07585 [Candidatus Melainabacteria bacterium]|nr:MAG: hypothetical protein C5B53_07585 [Candidatus Melainabacteria bacterium]